jgi:hypothetical protein
MHPKYTSRNQSKISNALEKKIVEIALKNPREGYRMSFPIWVFDDTSRNLIQGT